MPTYLHRPEYPSFIRDLRDIGPEIWKLLPDALATLIQGGSGSASNTLATDFPALVLGILKEDDLVDALNEEGHDSSLALERFDMKISEKVPEGMFSLFLTQHFGFLEDFIANLDHWHGLSALNTWDGWRKSDFQETIGLALGKFWLQSQPPMEHEWFYQRTAIEYFAEAFAFYYVGVLENVVSYVVQNPTPNDRRQLFEILRQSKLGPRFVDWLESKGPSGQTVLDELVRSPQTNWRLRPGSLAPSVQGASSGTNDHSRRPYHNTTLEVKVDNFETANKGQVDMANLVGKDKEAYDVLFLEQKRNPKDIRILFESAELSSLEEETLSAGTKIYGFSTMSTAGRDLKKNNTLLCPATIG
jgi:hypothetical protein